MSSVRARRRARLTIRPAGNFARLPFLNVKITIETIAMTTKTQIAPSGDDHPRDPRLLHRLRTHPAFISIKSFLRLFNEEAMAPSVARYLRVRAELNKPATRELNAKHQTALRYLNPYLAKRFGKIARQQILLSHYRFLEKVASRDFHARLLRAPLTVWEAVHGKTSCAINLSINPRHDGELSLNFTVNAILIYNLSFTIVPGEHVGSTYHHALLIGRLQGRRHFDLMKVASRACRHISPKYLLLAAVESFARSLGICVFAGVSTDNQVSNNHEPAFTFDYDECWETLCGVRNEIGFYEIPLPVFKKPLEEIPSSHRRNTRLKRAFKDAVGVAVCDVVSRCVLGIGHIAKHGFPSGVTQGATGTCRRAESARRTTAANTIPTAQGQYFSAETP